MHFVIIEDLSGDCDHLIKLLRQNCATHQEKVEFSGFRSAEDFLALYRPGFCSAIFLDILLDGKNGIAAAKSIRETDSSVPIIFTTSEAGFSLESYSVHALDYLVKPVSARSLSWCMDRIRSLAVTPEYITVREACRGESPISRRVPLDQLLYAESIRNGLILHTISEEIPTIQGLTMSQLSSLLPNTGRFYSVSRGILVNFSQIISIDGKGEIRLKNGETIYCSRRKTAMAREAFAEYSLRQFREGGDSL